MMRWQAVRRGVLTQFHQPQRSRTADQLTQNSVSGRKRTNGLGLLIADPDSQELGEPGAVPDHSERAVLGVHEHDGGLDDAAQHVRQLQPPAHGHHRFEQQMGRPTRALFRRLEALVQVVRQRAQLQARAFGPARSFVTHNTLRGGRPERGHTFHGSDRSRMSTLERGAERLPRAGRGPGASGEDAG